jgi:hypothetical protein
MGASENVCGFEAKEHMFWWTELFWVFLKSGGRYIPLVYYRRKLNALQ